MATSSIISSNTSFSLSTFIFIASLWRVYRIICILSCSHSLINFSVLLNRILIIFKPICMALLESCVCSELKVLAGLVCLLMACIVTVSVILALSDQGIVRSDGMPVLLFDAIICLFSLNRNCSNTRNTQSCF